MKKRHSREKEKKAESILDIYFGDDCDAALDRKIQRWFADNRDRQEKDDALERIWDDRVKPADRPDSYTYDSLKKMRLRLGFPEERPVGKTRMLHRKMFRIAAAVLLLVGLSGALFFLRDTPVLDRTDSTLVAVQSTTVISAENIASRHVVLPDGSEVWVRRGGTISFPDNFTTGRTVHLEGEAYFSVVKQDGKPFTVTGCDIAVNVLGTEFSVKAKEGAFPEVKLAEGSVEATVAGNTLKMKPGEGLLYDDRAGEVTLQQIEISAIAPWKNIDLIFAETPMKDVFRRIGNYFNVTLIIDQSLPLDRTLTATLYPDESLEDVLVIVRNTIKDFDFDVRENNTVIITRN